MSQVKVLRLSIVAGLVLAASATLAEPPSGPPSAAVAARGAAGIESDAAPATPLNPYVPPACTGVFTDVACPGGFAVNWIENFYADGITSGCSAAPLEYCPDAPVTRAQMAVFVERAMRGTGAWSPGDMGNRNTGLGAQALLNNPGYAWYNTAVGYQALYTQSFANGNVPYGPANTAIGVQALYQNQPDGGNGGYDGTTNTAVGAYAMTANTTGYYNTAVGAGAGESWPTGSANVFVGAAADAGSDGLTNAVAIGSGTDVDASNHVRIGNNSITQIGGAVGWSNLSDARAKTDIRDLDLGLDFVMGLRPVSFTMKSGNGRTDMGFVAQDVETLLGDGYNVLGIGGDAERTLSLRYTDLIAPMVKAIQEQQAQLAAKDSRIAALERNQTAQQAQIDELRRQMAALVTVRSTIGVSARP